EGLEERAESTSRRMLRRHGRLRERLQGTERTVHAHAPREHQRRMQERLNATRMALTRSAADLLERAHEGVATRQRELHRTVDARVERLELELARRAAEVEARSPLSSLARGYAVVQS